MPEFSARLDQIEQIADVTWNQRERLNQLAAETQEISQRLQTLTQMEGPLHQLATCRRAMEEQAAALGRMTDTLDTIAGLYRRTEQDNCRAAGDLSDLLWEVPLPLPIPVGPRDNEDDPLSQLLDRIDVLFKMLTGNLTTCSNFDPAGQMRREALQRVLWWLGDRTGTTVAPAPSIMLGSEIMGLFQTSTEKGAVRDGKHQSEGQHRPHEGRQRRPDQPPE